MTLLAFTLMLVSFTCEITQFGLQIVNDWPLRIDCSGQFMQKLILVRTVENTGPSVFIGVSADVFTVFQRTETQIGYLPLSPATAVTYWTLVSEIFGAVTLVFISGAPIARFVKVTKWVYQVPRGTVAVHHQNVAENIFIYNRTKIFACVLFRHMGIWLYFSSLVSNERRKHGWMYAA